MTEFDQFLDGIIAASEAVAEVLEAKRGLKHDRHVAHLAPAVARVKQVLAKYFTLQRDAFLTDVLPHLRSHIEQFEESRYGFGVLLQDDHGVFAEASKRKNGKQFANSIMPSSVSPLEFSVTDAMGIEYAAALTDAIAGAAAVVQADTATSAFLPNLASNYLRHNSLSKLTGNIGETSKTRLRNAIADAWDKGGTYNDLVGAIRDTFEDFSTVRASMIAQTEVVDAYNAGRNATARAAGLDEHAWETESGNPCETCLANEAQGWIPIDQDFDSGDDAPPAHPNCECVENFRKVSDVDDDES